MDTNAVNALNDVSYAYRNMDPDTGLYYGKQAMVLAEKLHWQPGLARAYSCMGNNYFSLSDPSGAMQSYQKALEIYERMGDDSGIAWGQSHIGSVYLYLMADYLRAQEYQERALTLFERGNDKKGIATTFGSLAIIYENIGDYPKALRNFQQAEDMYEKMGNKEGMATTTGNMGIFYDDLSEYSKALEYCKKSLGLLNSMGNKVGVAGNCSTMGDIYLDLSDNANALSYYKMAMAIYGQIGQKQGMARCFNNMGRVDATVLNYSEAMKCFRESLTLNSEAGDTSGVAAALNGMGYVYLHAPDSFIGVGRYSKALAVENKALQLSRKIGEVDAQQDELESLSEVYAKQKNFPKAYETYKAYVVIHDSILNDEKHKQITHKEIEYAYAKREDSLKVTGDKKDALAAAEIRRQKVIKNYTLGGVGFAGIFSFLLIVSYNRRKRALFDKRVSEVEMKAMHLQMNPHFIFNCMHSINKYLMDNETRSASEYLIRFSKLMRLILENSRAREVSLEKDLSALELYMELEALRFQHKFRYIIDVQPGIDQENTLIPPMLLQPFVENSILHGIQNKEGGVIKISVRKEEEMIRCIVEDNGIGRKQSITLKTEEDRKRESLGMKITQERLQILDKLKKVRTALVISDLKEINDAMSGLRVELLLPFEHAF